MPGFLWCDIWYVNSIGSSYEARGEGDTPNNGLYGEAPPERGSFFKLQVYERVGKSVICVCEKAQRAEQINFMAF